MYKKYITDFESDKLSQVRALLTDRDGAGGIGWLTKKSVQQKIFRSTLINHYFSLLYEVEYRQRHFKL